MAKQPQPSDNQPPADDDTEHWARVRAEKAARRERGDNNAAIWQKNPDGTVTKLT